MEAKSAGYLSGAGRRVRNTHAIPAAPAGKLVQSLGFFLGKAGFQHFNSNHVGGTYGYQL
jgi:hypothetical protein